MGPWAVNNFGLHFLLIFELKTSILFQPGQGSCEQADSLSSSCGALQQSILTFLAGLNHFLHVVSLALVRLVGKIDFKVLDRKFEQGFVFIKIDML